MRFAKYWAKGKIDWMCLNPASGIREPFACWGWSDSSPEDAAAKGRERAQEVARELQAGRRPDRYTYGDRPLKEQILEKWERAGGEMLAAITLNSYGCDIINTSDTAFVDVDLDDGNGRATGESRALGKLDNLLAGEGGYGAHVYRTAGGLRYLLTLERAVPNDERITTLMQQLDSDPLYIRLCRIQECFRARLTPKPWRCGVDRIRIAYPCNGPGTQAFVEKWRSRYGRASEGYAVCKRVGYFGSRHEGSNEFQRIMAYHERATKAATDLPLA